MFVVGKEYLSQARSDKLNQYGVFEDEAPVLDTKLSHPAVVLWLYL